MPSNFKSFYILLAFAFISSMSFAQQSISGFIVDSLTKQGIPGASVSILSIKDSLIASGISESRGHFIFKPIVDGTYKVRVNFVGYKSQRNQITLNSLVKAQSLTIALPLDMTMLNAVQIDIEPPMVVLKGDTTEYNAGSFTVEPYADADALIGQLPGAEIDEEGKLMVQGEDVQRILVDGKEFFSTDPRIALKTLPADIIDKIQIIDEKSDQAQFTGFDDGERKKIINIVTKPDKRHGYFGKIASGYGNQDRYNTGGSLNAFNGNRRVSLNIVSNNVNQKDFSMKSLVGGETNQDPRGRGRGGRSGGGSGSGLKGTNNIAMNFNNEWWDKLKLNGNYSFNNTNSSIINLINREYLIKKGGNQSTDKGNQLSIQNQQNNDKDRSHRANFRIEYEIDTNNSISFRPNVSYQKSGSIGSSLNKTSLNTQEPVNASARNNDNTRSNLNLSGDFTYRRKLNSLGRTLSLSINGSVNSNKGLAHNLSLNEFYKNFILNRTDTTNNENNTNANGNGLTGRLAYTEPVSKSSRLQVNYSIRNTNSYSNRETFDFLAETGQFDELNTKLSNEFRNDYTYHSGGVGYLFSKESIRFDVGLDFQKANLQNLKTFPIENRTSRGFASYLPSASFTYRFSKQKDIQINYSTATNAPNINQLQDVINNQNTLNIRKGNADLKQEYGHRFSLRYKTVNRERGSNFSANLSANFSNNQIVNSTFLATQDTVLEPGLILGKGGRFTRPENVDGYYTLRANATVGIPLKSLKMNLKLNTAMFNTREIGLLNNEVTYSNSSGVNQGISINSSISQKIIFSLAYNGNYSIVKNNMNPDLSYNFYNQNLRNDFTFIFWKGLRTSSTLSYHYNTGLTNNGSQSFILWNASLGKKFLKRQEAEITVTAYDILNKNTSFTRNISDQFIEDRESNMLNQYFILSLTYNLRKYGGGSGTNRSRNMNNIDSSRGNNVNRDMGRYRGN